MTKKDIVTCILAGIMMGLAFAIPFVAMAVGLV